LPSQRIAARAVTNLISGGSVTQIITLSQNGVLKPMCELLEVIDEEVLLF
jgi:hypothetical protein